MHGVADRVARRNLELAQEQNGGSGKVLAMPAAGAQQETAYRSILRLPEFVALLPGAVRKLALKEPVDLLQNPLQALTLVGQLQLRNDLCEGGDFLEIHVAVFIGFRARIQVRARSVARIENCQSHA